MIGHIILRLIIWFLLTANFSPINIAIGVAIALLLPFPTRRSRERLPDLLSRYWKIVQAIPQAYIEAVELILHPHTEEHILRERARTQRSPGLIFLDVFLITFTPKTTVLNYHDDDDSFEVHRVERRSSKS